MMTPLLVITCIGSGFVLGMFAREVWEIIVEQYQRCRTQAQKKS